ncbi:unnamed protein product, partial [marine sediment metagenome]
THNTATNVLTNDVWQHVVVTWDTTSDNYKLYVNNSLITPDDTSTVGDPSGIDKILIGDTAAGTRPFNGIIDEVRVYDRVLSADEIGELYRAGARKLITNAPITNKQTGGLVGHWTFNGGDMDWGSNTAYDRSGEGNNGIITNMSTTTSVTGGISGQALEFDGVDDYVSVGDDSSLDFGTNNFGISGWFKTAGSYTGVIYAKGDGDANDNTLQVYTRTSDPYLRIYTESGGTPSQTASMSQNVHDNLWHHFVAQRLGTAHQIYIDG